MICPVCNQPYPCAHSRGSQGDSDGDIANSGPEAPRPASPAIDAPGVITKPRADGELWRREVALRVRQHRARRRRYDPNSSLDLDFPSDAAVAFAPDLTGSMPEFFEPLESSSPTNELSTEEAAENWDIAEASDEVANEIDVDQAEAASPPPSAPRKIIRFPKYEKVEPRIVFRPPLEEPELAEPAPETPRILDAPEPEAGQMELLPSFDDIRLDEPTPVNLCEELESAPHPAALTRRLASSAVDSGIVLLAAGLFAVCFAQIVEAVPSSRSVLLFAVAVGAILWLIFQYLFLVYGAATPGMRATQLELFSFNGRRPSRLSRRVRALATTLSALSIGLGFAWALVDEDTLGWHDRISQTYVRSSS